MAFRIPTFNLTCNIWTDWTNQPIYPIVAAPRLSLVPCQLREMRTAFLATTGQGMYMLLVLPKGTDLRGGNRFTGVFVSGDAVEVPSGSGRFYECDAVDDVAKGFPNEYRTGAINPLAYHRAGAWPIVLP
jgi:hypothetical protein